MRFDYFLWFLATAGLLTVSEVTGEEAPLPGALEEPASDPIPEPYPVSRYQRVWEQSPFQLDAAPVAAVATNRVSFARDYVLVGTIKKGDAYTVYIMNKRTKDVTKVLQDQATSDGFELVSVSPGDGPGRYSAVVKKNNERATLKYEDMATTQARAGSPASRRRTLLLPKSAKP